MLARRRRRRHNISAEYEVNRPYFLVPRGACWMLKDQPGSHDMGWLVSAEMTSARFTWEVARRRWISSASLFILRNRSALMSCSLGKGTTVTCLGVVLSSDGLSIRYLNFQSSFLSFLFQFIALSPFFLLQVQMSQVHDFLLGPRWAADSNRESRTNNTNFVSQALQRLTTIFHCSNTINREFCANIWVFPTQNTT